MSRYFSALADSLVGAMRVWLVLSTIMGGVWGRAGGLGWA
jgi:hypothetical protein